MIGSFKSCKSTTNDKLAAINRICRQLRCTNPVISLSNRRCNRAISAREEITSGLLVIAWQKPRLLITGQRSVYEMETDVFLLNQTPPNSYPHTVLTFRLFRPLSHALFARDCLTRRSRAYQASGAPYPTSMSTTKSTTYGTRRFRPPTHGPPTVLLRQHLLEQEIRKSYTG
jgi:hypothetical protein